MKKLLHDLISNHYLFCAFILTIISTAIIAVLSSTSYLCIIPNRQEIGTAITIGTAIISGLSLAITTLNGLVKRYDIKNETNTGELHKGKRKLFVCKSFIVLMPLLFSTIFIYSFRECYSSKEYICRDIVCREKPDLFKHVNSTVNENIFSIISRATKYEKGVIMKKAYEFQDSILRLQLSNRSIDKDCCNSLIDSIRLMSLSEKSISDHIDSMINLTNLLNDILITHDQSTIKDLLYKNGMSDSTFITLFHFNNISFSDPIQGNSLIQRLQFIALSMDNPKVEVFGVHTNVENDMIDTIYLNTKRR